jgi:hypothetical protein
VQKDSICKILQDSACTFLLGFSSWKCKNDNNI